MGSQKKSRRKVVWRISCITEGVYTIRLRVPRYRATEEVYSAESLKIGIESHSQIYPRAGCTTSKFGKERVHRKELRKSANLKSTIPLLQNSRKEHRIKLCSKKDAPQAFYSPTEAWVMPAPSSKKPEERESVVDSRASMHMLSTKDLSSDERETLRRSRNATTTVTANGEVQTNEEAQVYVHDLHLFVTVQILDDTPAVQSLGKLCAVSGASGQKPRLTKQVISAIVAELDRRYEQYGDLRAFAGPLPRSNAPTVHNTGRSALPIVLVEDV